MPLPLLDKVTASFKKRSPDRKSPAKKLSLPKFRRVKDYLCIDLSGPYVKLVYAKDLAGKTIVEGIASKQFAEDAEVDIAQFIRDKVKEFEAVTRKVICSISSAQFISKNIDMPSSNSEEIAKIINLQVGRFTPYSREEIVVDYLSREMPEQHYTNVLLIIMHRKIVERFYRIMDQTGLSIDRIVIGSEALAKSYGLWKEVVPDGKTCGGIHISEAVSDLTVIEQGNMVFVRSIPIGADNFRSNKEAATTEFMNEMSKSVSAYQDEGVGQKLGSVLISGHLKGLEFLKDALKANVPALATAGDNIHLVTYRDRFDLSDSAKKVLEEEKSVSYFELLASILSVTQMKVDLIPSEMKLKRDVREGGRDVITLGILIMTIFLMISFLLSVKIYFKSVQMGKLQAIDEATFEQARSLERISTKSRATRKFLEKRGRGLYVFDKVTALIGGDIFLNQFSYDFSGNLVLAGTAESMSRIFAFVTTLEESNYFSNVTTLETKSRREGKKEVADFLIECKLAEGF